MRLGLAATALLTYGNEPLVMMTAHDSAVTNSFVRRFVIDTVSPRFQKLLVLGLPYYLFNLVSTIIPN